MIIRAPALPSSVLFVATALSVLGTRPVKAADKNEAWVEVRSPHFTVASNAGEKQARRVASHFEQIRAAFETARRSIRLDPAQPIIILAAKNEDTLKSLLPKFWEQKGHTHPAGVFIAGEEKNYVALRLDVTDENPYHPLYHEYVHLLLNLNFRRLPLWLNEGFAEFYANIKIGDKEMRVGMPDPQHIALLRESKPLPLDVLLTVNWDSPYYNEASKTSIFYAESWALVHYLMVDPEKSRAQPLATYLSLLQGDLDELEAARRTFGNLQTLGAALEEYVRQPAFYQLKTNAPAGISGTGFVARTLSPAESLALRGDFHLHTRRLAEARPLLEEALRLDPNLAQAHESMGFLHYRLGEHAEAAEWFAQAVKLDSRSALAHYFHAMLMLEDTPDPELFPEAEANLRRAIELNPNFAPAYATLAGFYGLRKETLGKAVEAASKAIQLEPGVNTHYLNLARILMRAERFADARVVAQRLLVMAKSPEERIATETFLQELARYQDFVARRKQSEEQQLGPALRAGSDATASTEPESKDFSKITPSAGPATPPTRLGSASGKITEVSCQNPPAMNIALDLGARVLRLHAANFFKVDYLTTHWQPPDRFDPCVHLKGRRAQISYHLLPAQDSDGEIVSIEVRK